MRESIKEARSVDEAIELACRELGVERDVIEFEIINLPKRGFLGLRITPAKVRVYVEEIEKPESRIVETKKAERPAVEKNVKNLYKPQQRQEQKRDPKPAFKQENKTISKAEPKPESAKKTVQQSAPVEELDFVSADTVDGKAKTAVDYIKSVLAEMNVYPAISVAFTESGMILRLSGEGLGVIIGRRGETLDSLQYLAGLVANREEGDYMRVTIDSGNYREKRERTLEQLARKLSASAIRYGRASTLEPMNPYERRIIHATVSTIEGVSSTSIGEEPNRRVVITPANLKPQNRRNRNNRSNGGAKSSYKNSAPSAEGLTDENKNEKSENRSYRPRRDNRDRQPVRRDNRNADSNPTSTAIDREYAREIEREAPVFVKPDASEKTAAVVREKAVPTRTQPAKEVEDLPLYGKIEL